MPDKTALKVSRQEAEIFLRALFEQAGVETPAAASVAAGLVEADLQGVHSHGMLQAPNYLRRLRAGTIAKGSTLKPVHQSAAISVFDAGLILGHPGAEQAMTAATDSARQFGIAAVAVRAATHFGVAGRYVRSAADAGLIGIAMCNTRPMLPAPGGDQAVVGNNPLSIAVPCAGRAPIVFDMAMSAASMGKVRLAAQRGEPIPLGWAVDETGTPTTDAQAAIKGMLLPAAGAKGFGLALMVDFLCALSGGSAGSEVATTYGPADRPADCSWFFIAIDPAHFGLDRAYTDHIAELAGHIADRSPLPGDGKLAAAKAAADMVTVQHTLAAELEALSLEMGGASRLQPVPAP